MVLHDTPIGALAIAQPAHAWLAGRLAAAWAPWPGPLAPLRDEVAMAAGIHDLAWGERDTAPVHDPHTGLPQRFLDVPVGDHVALWASATGLARPFGALPALLVSRHGTRLMRGRLAEGDDAVAAHLEREARKQDELIGELGASPVHRDLDVDAAAALLAVWDTLSLSACQGPREQTVPDVPWGEERVELAVAPASDGALTVAPWPFAPRAVHLAVAGREVARTADRAALDAAWSSAPTVWLDVTLRPA
jgi:hypothetical protein